jgi:hypothetical protein
MDSIMMAAETDGSALRHPLSSWDRHCHSDVGASRRPVVDLPSIPPVGYSDVPRAEAVDGRR